MENRFSYIDSIHPYHPFIQNRFSITTVWEAIIIVKRLVVTGYKHHELGIFDDKHPGIRFIKKALEKRLVSLTDEGLEWVIISGQLGNETWAAEVVY